MIETSKTESIESPFQILGLADDANEHQVRARYLELVKQFPPESEPEKFRQIQSAYSAARDPLVLAQLMLALPDPEDIPTWKDAIDSHANRPPVMSSDFVLSLGNQSDEQSDDSANHDQGESDG